MSLEIYHKRKLLCLEDAIKVIYEDAVRDARYKCKDEFLGEDILHEVLIKLIQNQKTMANRFETISKFKAFVGLSVRNKFLDHVRKEERSPLTGYGEDDVILKVHKETPVVEEMFEVEEAEKLWNQNKDRFIAARSWMNPDQYLMMTLRMAGWSFKDISELLGISINTALGMMRYATINVQAKLGEKKLRRKRFREVGKNKYPEEKLFKQLPPYQYFVIKMKMSRPELTFGDISKLEGSDSHTLAYDRWRWAKKNLERMCKTEEEYLAVLDFMEHINPNNGGSTWHKSKPTWPLREKQKFALEYIEKRGKVTPKQLGIAWHVEKGGSIDRSGACSTLKSLEKRKLIKGKNGEYKKVRPKRVGNS